MTASNERQEAVERLVVELGVAFQNRGVYPSGHPALRGALARAVAAHWAMLAQADDPDETTLLVVEERLLVDRVPVAEDAAWSRVLLLAFARHRFSGLTLLAGLDGDELAAFLDSCHAESGPQPSRHLVIGRVGSIDAEVGPALGVEPVERLPPLARPEELAAGREDFAAVAAWSAPDLDGLRSLVAALARAAAGVRLAPPRLATVDAGDREFLHGLATALGTLRLGRALGLDGDRLHDLGLAGLLHDVGRLEAPPPLAGAAALHAHPVVGAAQLAATPGAPAVAVVVAFEHHLRFDRAPHYPRLPEPRRPSAAAQLVAVADTWDTLRGRGRLPREEAARQLRQRAGTYLNPALVEVFSALLGDPAG